MGRGDSGPGDRGGRGGEPPPGEGFGPPPGGAISEPPQGVVVIVVPIDKVREMFLDPLNEQQDHQVNAVLVNDSGEVLISSGPWAIGSSFLDVLDAQSRAKMAVAAFQRCVARGGG